MRRAPGGVLLEVDWHCSLVSSLLSGAAPAPSCRTFLLPGACTPTWASRGARLWAPGSCSVGAKCTGHAPHWNTQKGRAAPAGGELRQGWAHKWEEPRVTTVAAACGM